MHFGIDSMRPGPEGKVNSLVHKACLELDITHIESLCNLEALIGKGQFTFIGLPMKWRGGTGSPIRASAGVRSDDRRWVRAANGAAACAGSRRQPLRHALERVGAAAGIGAAMHPAAAVDREGHGRCDLQRPVGVVEVVVRARIDVN